MSAELRHIVEQLGVTEGKAVKLPSSGGGLAHDFDINPDEFLQRAEDDYEQGGNAALLNAITNAKRAIHCQIDQALACLGFETARRNLPKKVELLVSLGFVAPRILRRVTEARNVLEHEYKAPTLQQVEEALDLAALFIEATNRHLDIFEDDFALGNYDEQLDRFTFTNELRFQMLEKPYKHFQVIGYCRLAKPQEVLQSVEIVGRATVTPAQELYKDVVCLVIASDRQSKVHDAIAKFFATLNKY